MRSPQRPTDHPRYGFHRRHADVRLARGRAAEHQCVDCEKQALDWSQVHDTDGTNPHEHYQPRCRSCHKKYDMTDEFRQRMSEVQKGKPKSPEHRAKIMANLRRK